MAEFARELGLSLAVINPRQVRDLAKTDTLDAAVIARFAVTIKPPAHALRDKERMPWSAWLPRRRQLVLMRTQKNNRLGAANGGRHDIDLTAALRQSEVWRVKGDPLKSFPGIGPVNCVTLLSLIPELGKINRAEIAAIAGWRRSTAIAVSITVST